MFYYFANLHPKTYKMTDDLANVLTDWAEFNGIQIEAVISTTEYHVVSLDSDLGSWPFDLYDAVHEDYTIIYHEELTPDFLRLIPKSDFAKNQTLGVNYEDWSRYSETPRHATWDGEP